MYFKVGIFGYKHIKGGTKHIQKSLTIEKTFKRPGLHR